MMPKSTMKEELFDDDDDDPYEEGEDDEDGLIGPPFEQLKDSNNNYRVPSGESLTAR